MNRPAAFNASLERLELMETVSKLRREVDERRYKRQRLIAEIKQKRAEAAELKEKRDSFNAEVKRLVAEAKVHLEKRDRVQKEIKALKEKRAEIQKNIKPRAEKIRSDKHVRRILNRAAGASLQGLREDFAASLKTLFGMELSLREEVIMVEMVMDLQRRYNARKNAESISEDIHETWETIKEIEEDASRVSFKIMSLAADGQAEHLAAMELFDRKNEASAQGQEIHERYVQTVKEIRAMSREIDAISKEIDIHFKKLKPKHNELNRLRLRRREEQQLAKLKAAKEKMDALGRIGLEDLKVLLNAGAITVGKEKKVDVEEERKRREEEQERKRRENEERNRRLAEEKRRRKEEEKRKRQERMEKRKREEEERRKKEVEEKRKRGKL